MEDLFEYYLETKNFHLKYAKGEPSAKDREIHHYHEFVLFLDGNSTLISKNIQQELTPGNLVLIPKEHLHQFCITAPAEYKRCIIGFCETPEISGLIRTVMTEVKVIYLPNQKITELFENLMETAKSRLADTEKHLLIQASLLQLLVYSKQFASEEISRTVNISPVTQQAIRYMDSNYSQKLSVQDMARHLYVSPSTLAHTFKKEMNISLYQYLSKRRISAVHKLIENGESYTEAVLKSGFSDYSCFYRIQKKYHREKG